VHFSLAGAHLAEVPAPLARRGYLQ